MRWSTTHENRRAIGAQKRRLDKSVQSSRQAHHFNPYASEYNQACTVRLAAMGAAERLTLAKRKEQAALRALAKVCAKLRGNQHQAADATVIDDVAVKFLPC